MTQSLMPRQFFEIAKQCKGFFSQQEGLFLYEKLLPVLHLGPALEIGSYCGKSSVFMAAACQQKQRLLFCVDHHQGSEEHQVGEAYHDPELIENGCFDTFSYFKSTLKKAKLDKWVIPIVAPSQRVGSVWTTPLSAVFIDGSHAYESVKSDYKCFAKHIVKGGLLIFHDIFENPEEGGQAPYLVYKEALNDLHFKQVHQLGCLRFLEKLM